jgi:hypothetical protein
MKRIPRPFQVGDIACYVDTTKYAPNYNGVGPPPSILLRCLVLSEGKRSTQHRKPGFKYEMLILTNNFSGRINIKIDQHVPENLRFYETDKCCWQLEFRHAS